MLAAQNQLPLIAVSGLAAITIVYNTGIVFGLLQGNSLFFGIISGVAAVLIILYHKRLKAGVEMAAGTLILAGTVSNLFDRLFRGGVIDYISVWGLPTFNLADAALTIGASLLITGYILQISKKGKKG